MRFRILFWRGCRLRCPLCGRGKLFRNWLKMHSACSVCGATFHREGGFYLGSIYFNYGLTSLILATAYPALLFTGTITREWLTATTIAFVVLFPIWFFRYARSLWLGFDQYWDPRAGEIGTSRRSSDEE